MDAVGAPAADAAPASDPAPPADVEPQPNGATEEFDVEWQDGAYEFEPAHESAVGGREILDALPGDASAAATVRAQIDDVVETEGPVEISRLVRVVARRFGLAAVRTGRAEVIQALVPQEQIIRDSLGTFVWPRGADPEEWGAFRVPAEGHTLRLEEVPPQEICNAMIAIVEHEPDVTEEEVIRETAALFGISRLGSLVRARLEAVLARGIRDSWIDAREDSASAPPAS